MTTHESLAKIRGDAPEKRPTVRVLAAASAHNDCAFSRLALASRTDLENSGIRAILAFSAGARTRPAR